jgi:triosephosphate isomerase (TIM)
MKKLLVANWKMNKNLQETEDFIKLFKASFSHHRDAWIAPQAMNAFELIKSGIPTGLQNCSEYEHGAYTGELSAQSFKTMGGSFVILGHSERRQYFKETNSQINAKIKTALKAGLRVIYCVGETLTERESHQTLPIISSQLHQGLIDVTETNAENLIIAYEPVWAIGTGKTATPQEAQAVHAFIREELTKKFPTHGDKVPLLYGGSMKPDNVEKLLEQKDIDGGLVGGASLKAADFLALCADRLS